MDQDKLAVDEIFFAALERTSDGERSACLDEMCGGDNEIRRRVERLLSARTNVDSFLEQPAPGVEVAAYQDDTDLSGTQIGPYKLLERIGEGGMGTVYMARQSEPIKRRVALKLIKAGMDTRQVIARFEAERQALAVMDHPGIARVFDAGATDTGRPYFVMELVRGTPITTFCDTQRLDLRQRLELFVQVSHAVQHAHQKGIIHRDLKPSNVMVAMYDDQPVSKVIDFGVAKATDEQLTEKTFFTRFGQMVGTLEYMSPEQTQLNQVDVDTRSDIYSLGVILYELLTGVPPFEKERIRNAAFDETLKMIREEEPTKPSTRLRDSDELPSIADNRKLAPAKLGSLVKGELDWIVMKSLEKDRTRRYETANGFAGDIQRYLADEPVLACPPSTTYRLKKFLSRNRALVATVAMIMASLIAGLVGTSWQAIRATAAENKTAEEAAIAWAVNEFLNTDLLGAADPHAEPDRELKVREVLDRAARNVAGRFADQPLVEAAIRTTIGNSYSALGQYDEAEPHLQRAQELRRQHLGDDDVQTLNTSLSLTWLAHDRGQYPQAHARLEEIAERSQRILGEESLTTISALEQLGDVKRHLGQYDEALSLGDKVIELRRRIQGPEHPDTLRSMSLLATYYKHAGQYQKSLSLLEQTLELRTEVLGPEHPGTLTSMGSLVEGYAQAARYDRAIELGRQCLELKRKILGREHPHTLISMVNLANAYERAGQHDTSIKLYEPALELMHRIHGPQHPHTLTLINNLAGAFHSAGQYENALVLYEQTLELNPKVRGLEHPITLRTMNNRVVLYHAQGKYAEAEKLCKRVLEIQRRVLGPEHPDTLSSRTNLAAVYQAQRKYALAEPILIEVLDTQRRVLGAEDPETLTTMGNLAISYKFTGQFEKSLELHEQTLELKRKVRGPEHPETLTSMDNLAKAYGAAGQFDKALKLHKQTLELFRKVLDPEHPETLTALGNLAQAYGDVGQLDKALELHQQTLVLKRKILGPKHPRTVTTMTNLATAYAATGHFAEVQSLGTELLAIQRRTLAPDDPRLNNTLAILGQSLIVLGQSAEAQPLLLECLEIREEKLPDAWPTFSAMSLLGECLSTQGKHEEADTFLIDGYQGLKARSDEWPASVRQRRLSEALKRLISHYESISQPEQLARWQAELQLQLAESDMQPREESSTTDKERLKPKN